MSKPKILVIGDRMVDRYWFADPPTRVSPEAPIPVHRIYRSSEFPGGAGNVWHNLLTLGADARIVNGTQLIGTLVGEGDPKIPTKHRLMVNDRQIARWDEWDDVDPIDLEALDQAILHWMPDAIVVSDYGKGSISDEVIQWVGEQERPTFIDTKRQPDDFTRVFGRTFFPNEAEYKHYQELYDQSHFVYKRGAKGIQYRGFDKVYEEYPAWAKRVVSVCGAGDTVIAAYAYAYCKGYKPLPFANAAAAAVVAKPWTATTTEKEVLEILQGKLTPVSV